MLCFMSKICTSDNVLGPDGQIVELIYLDSKTTVRSYQQDNLICGPAIGTLLSKCISSKEYIFNRLS